MFSVIATIANQSNTPDGNLENLKVWILIFHSVILSDDILHYFSIIICIAIIP